MSTGERRPELKSLVLGSDEQEAAGPAYLGSEFLLPSRDSLEGTVGPLEKFHPPGCGCRCLPEAGLEWGLGDTQLSQVESESLCLPEPGPSRTFRNRQGLTQFTLAIPGASFGLGPFRMLLSDFSPEGGQVRRTGGPTLSPRSKNALLGAQMTS